MAVTCIHRHLLSHQVPRERVVATPPVPVPQTRPCGFSKKITLMEGDVGRICFWLKFGDDLVSRKLYDVISHVPMYDVRIKTHTCDSLGKSMQCTLTFWRHCFVFPVRRGSRCVQTCFGATVETEFSLKHRPNTSFFNMTFPNTFEHPHHP